MKKYLLCIACFMLCFKSFAQHIDDEGFAKGIRNQCFTCIDAANNLTDVARIQTHLTVSLLNVASLKGIEGFSSLSSINCTNSKLTTLPDNMPSTLQYINVEFNQITSLPILPSRLRTLDCSNNFLTSLPILPSGLRIFDCSYNNITALPALPNDLTTLFCSNNLLTNIPSLPSKLEGFMCAYNHIKTLPLLPKTLIRLSCHFTDVTCLPLLPDSLVYLDISKPIVCLPNILKKVTIDLYESVTPKTITLPFCNDLRPPPCDTFPRNANAIQDSINAVNNGKNPSKITIFPNPTEGVVKIKCANCTVKKVAVFNSIGQLVIETQAVLLDFSKLSAGMYIVRVETVSGEKVVEKIMRM
jgi:Leucine-rich repeat (LRR) protein